MGSIEYVHRKIVEIRDAGVAVLLISSELDEIVALGDRVAVMYEGRDRRHRAAVDESRAAGLMMAGRHRDVRDAVGAVA